MGSSSTPEVKTVTQQHSTPVQGNQPNAAVNAGTGGELNNVAKSFENGNNMYRTDVGTQETQSSYSDQLGGNLNADLSNTFGTYGQKNYQWGFNQNTASNGSNSNTQMADYEPTQNNATSNGFSGNTNPTSQTLSGWGFSQGTDGQWRKKKQGNAAASNTSGYSSNLGSV